MSTLSWLDPHSLEFPPIEQALEDPDGLIAVGGDLSIERLLAAYRQGIFPWYEAPQPILWWSPNPRTVLFPDKIHISKSLSKRLRRQEYRISFDMAFDQVIEQCANTLRNGRNDTWIGLAMIEAYRRLHKHGYAHSVECWYQGQLVGGLYGIAIGRMFYGESMFSLRTDASKAAFVHLARQLHRWDFAMIDCQVSNPHLLSMGAEEIDRGRFIDIVTRQINLSGPDPEAWKINDSSI